MDSRSKRSDRSRAFHSVFPTCEPTSTPASTSSSRAAVLGSTPAFRSAMKISASSRDFPRRSSGEISSAVCRRTRFGAGGWNSSRVSPGGARHRRPLPTPRWQPRTASSDNSSFRTCSAASRRSLRFAPASRGSGLDAGSARAPQRAIVRRCPTPLPSTARTILGRCSQRWTPHCAAPERDSTQRLESQPQSHHRREAAASERRPRWTDGAPCESRESVMRRE